VIIHQEWSVKLISHRVGLPVRVRTQTGLRDRAASL